MNDWHRTSRRWRATGTTAALAVALGLAAWWALLHSNEAGSPAPAPRDVPFSALSFPEADGDGDAEATPRPPRLHWQATRFEPAPVATRTPSRALMRYQSPDSMRKFVLDTLRDGGRDGAAFYAYRGLQDCLRAGESSDVLRRAQPAYDPAMSDTEYARRVAASDYLRRRCADTVQGEVADLMRSLPQKAQDARDTASMAVSRWSAALDGGSSDEIHAAFGDLMQLGDPVVIDTIGMENVLPPGPDGQGPVLSYKGRHYAEVDTPEVFDALKLLPCGIGLRCDAKEGPVGMACAAGGPCFADRFDAMKNGNLKDKPDQYARTLDFYQQMVHSINTGATDDFKP